MRYNRSQCGVPKDWLFILTLQIALPAAGIVSGCFLPVVAGARQGDLTLFWVALASALIGIVLLLGAKWPLYRQGKYLAFGSKALPRGSRKAYRMAYIFIGVSVLMLLLLLAVLR